MTKNHYSQYTRPLIRSFENKKFLTGSKLLLSFIRSTALKKVLHFEDRHWIFVNPSRMRSYGWMPKVYVCVAPRDFWSTIHDLILLSRKAKLHWKFCKNFKFFGRPDKIVIYARDPADLRRIVRLLRPLLKGKHFHKIKFASSTVQSHIEAKGHGLYVGSDPEFLKNVSWGIYRWAIEEAVIKANKGTDKNMKAALKKLNVTLKHRGPDSFAPDKKNNSYVKQIWKELSS